MLSHGDIWIAIDRLATRNGLTASGLARRAGLDPTTFNRSKRTTRDGKPRWPSTESVSKILHATGSSFSAFVGLIEGDAREMPRRIPVLGYAQAGRNGHFDDGGLPTGAGWDEIEFPDLADEKVYALEISGNSMEPLYRDGDVIIVSPGATVRRGDRVVVRTKAGEVMAKQLARRTAKRVDLISLNPMSAAVSLDAGEVAWLARIVWASQ